MLGNPPGTSLTTLFEQASIQSQTVANTTQARRWIAPVNLTVSRIQVVQTVQPVSAGGTVDLSLLQGGTVNLLSTPTVNLETMTANLTQLLTKTPIIPDRNINSGTVVWIDIVSPSDMSGPGEVSIQIVYTRR